MRYTAESFDEYMVQLPEDRREPFTRLREIIIDYLPKGFEERFSNGFLHYVVPFEQYPSGYHANPKEPLPFISIASQKHFIAFYHLGLYAFEDIKDWFIDEYSKHVTTKLDIGKSCIRFKNMNHIPYQMIAELCQKITVPMWIEKYESAILR